MKYISTRDASVVSSFENAICSGYAKDGGLFVPEFLPKISPKTLQSWSCLTYPKLTLAILRLYISAEEISDADLADICQSALQGFDNPDQAVPLRKIGGIYVAELFHGPTFCFKDLGLRALVGLLSHFATRRNRKMTLLVATTGDTGPAAVKAVSDIDNPLLTILVHYPQGQISDFQRKQLTTIQSPCVKVVAFEGGGDDMDRPIKNLQAHRQQNGKPEDGVLTGVNSYNIARPLMQMVHYVWSYLRVMDSLQETPGNADLPIDLVLPTGAMGNAVGGYMAKRMGVPLGMISSGVNINDITYRVMKTGKFHKSDVMEKTLSDAINIQLPYNFERLLYYLAGCDHSAIKAWMTTVDLTSKNDLSPEWLSLIQAEFRCERVTDEEMCATIRQVLSEHHYMIDPHTAVAFAAAKKFGYYDAATDLSIQTKPVILLSTASPCKFEESVTIAVGSENWKKFRESDFPSRGTSILDLDEVQPILYKAKHGVPLDEIQKDWEAQSASIIALLLLLGKTE